MPETLSPPAPPAAGPLARPSAGGGAALLQGLRRTLRRIIFALIAAAMLALIAAIFLQVFFRYALNDPLTWPEELGRYLFVWIVFLGIPEAWREGKHLGMDLFAARLPRPLRRVLARAVEVLVLAFAAVVAWTSLELVALTHDQTAAVLRIPISWVYVSFTIGFVLVIVETVAAWFAGDGRPSPGEHLYGLGPPAQPLHDL